MAYELLGSGLRAYAAERKIGIKLHCNLYLYADQLPWRIILPKHHVQATLEVDGLPKLTAPIKVEFVAADDAKTVYVDSAQAVIDDAGSLTVEITFLLEKDAFGPAREIPANHSLQDYPVFKEFERRVHATLELPALQGPTFTVSLDFASALRRSTGDLGIWTTADPRSRERA